MNTNLRASGRGFACVGLIVGIGYTAVGQPGGPGPTCRFSKHIVDNQWGDEQCEYFYSCCRNEYGIDHGPFSNDGEYSSLGAPQTVLCNGTKYTGQLINGVCVQGAYVGEYECEVTLLPNAISCIQ